MLRITRLTAQGTTRDGARLFDYLKATEYYIGKDGQAHNASRWTGKGAALLGLEGDVDLQSQDMNMLGAGFAPDGTPLAQNAGETSRVGWDLTWSAPKSVSVLFAAADPEERDRIMQAHSNAVDAALAYMEDCSAVRYGKGGHARMRTNGIVASAHTHLTNRELEPQLHTHTLVYNIAQGVDGQWRRLDTNDWDNNVKAAGALFRAQLAHEIQQLGYGIEKTRELDEDGRETGNDFFRVLGVTDEYCEGFSTRRKQILEYQQTNNVSAYQAALATRKIKDEPAFPELVENWGQALDKLEKETGHKLDVHALKAPEFQTVQSEQSDMDITRRLHLHEATFTRENLIARVAMENVGNGDIKAMIAEAEQVRERAGYVHTPDPNAQHKKYGGPQETFTSPMMIGMERGIQKAGIERANDESVRVPEAIIDQERARYEEARGFTVSDEQIAGAKHLCSGTGGLGILSGQAGTGKTTTAELCVASWRANGQEVIGTSTSWKAAEKLETEAGIESYSADKLLWDLDSGARTLNAKSVVLFDEAGMAGTQHIYRLQKHTDAAGAKLVLMGDAQQLQPVAAGNPFAMMTETIGDAELTEIRRQKSEADRETARMHYDAKSGADLVDRLAEREQLEVVDNRKEAYQAIADQYMQSATPDREKLVLGSTNAEVAALNEAIRERRVDAGLVEADGITVDTVSQGKKQTTQVSVGDRIVFGKRDLDKGLTKGLDATIDSIEPGKEPGSWKITATTESDIKEKDGLTVEFDTSEYRHFDLGYAGTIHKSQGQGKAEVFHLANPAMTDKHLQLVAFTRSKESYRMFALADDIEELKEKASEERMKVNAVDLLKAAAEKRDAKKVDAPETQVDVSQLFKGPTHERMVKRQQDGIAFPAGPKPETGISHI